VGSGQKQVIGSWERLGIVETGELSEREAARRLGVARSTFHKWTHD